MPVVFRVQDADGRGPWKPGFSHNWVVDRPDHENLLPSYQEFDLPQVKRSALYGAWLGTGCTTLKQLRRWFTFAEYLKLMRFGYQAVEMEVGRILAESNTQCVFERAKPLNADLNVILLYPEIHPK